MSLKTNDFTKLLNHYYKTRLSLNNALSEYNKEKAKCRKVLKAENQTQKTLLDFAQENNLKLDEIVIEWNENVIPITLMKINQVRQMHEQKCRDCKKKVYECQINFSKALQEINNYILYDKC